MKIHYRRILLAFLYTGAFGLAATNSSFADAIVTFEAESGTLGADWTTVNGTPTYITSISTAGGENPGSAARVSSYSVTFPEVGTYNLFARVRTGPLTFEDDSFFYGNGFGFKSAAADADWIRNNNTVTGGFTNASDVVAGAGAAGGNGWKWVNLSQYTGDTGETPITFTVTEGNLMQTFQIGARENGFDMDKFAFGTMGVSFTVMNLDSGTLPSPPPPLTNAFPDPDGIAFHRFGPLNNGVNTDGANPAAGLALSGNVLVGTTLNGGSQGAGTAFTMSLDGTNFTAFRTFAATPDANNPRGELSFSGSRFYGTSIAGGGGNAGSVFVGETNGSVLVLRSFAVVSDHYATNSGGASPGGNLVLSQGMIYGTASAGGSAGNGTIFSLTTNGATFSVLRNFSVLNAQTGTNTDGAIPMGGLVLSGDTLYGTASGGGAGGNGVVFSIRTNGAGFTTLNSFSPMDTQTGTNVDGAMPMAGLVLVSNKLYGTTYAGGIGGRGTIFSLETNGSGFAVLHHFAATHPVTGTNTDGASPSAALYFSANILYGTTSKGGVGGAGTVFGLGLGSQQISVLQNFSALSGSGTNASGAYPVAPVVRVGDSLYGTTFSGGPGAAGTVFSVPDIVSVPAVPAVITNAVLNLDSTVTLYFVGGLNSTNVVQSTASLTSPVSWQNSSTNVADPSGAWQFTDALNLENRFYRSFAQ